MSICTYTRGHDEVRCNQIALIDNQYCEHHYLFKGSAPALGLLEYHLRKRLENDDISEQEKQRFMKSIKLHKEGHVAEYYSIKREMEQVKNFYQRGKLDIHVATDKLTNLDNKLMLIPAWDTMEVE